MLTQRRQGAETEAAGNTIFIFLPGNVLAGDSTRFRVFRGWLPQAEREFGAPARLRSPRLCVSRHSVRRDASLRRVSVKPEPSGQGPACQESLLAPPLPHCENSFHRSDFSPPVRRSLSPDRLRSLKEQPTLRVSLSITTLPGRTLTQIKSATAGAGIHPRKMAQRNGAQGGAASASGRIPNRSFGLHGSSPVRVFLLCL